MVEAFNRLKIQSKLMVIFGAIILIGVLITGWTVISVTALDTLTLDLEATEFELSAAAQTRNLVRELELAELSYVLTGDEKFIHEHEHYQLGVEEYVRNALIRSDDSAIQTLLHQFERELRAYQNTLEEIVLAIEVGNHEEAEALGLETSESLEGMESEIGDVIALMQPRLDEQVAESDRQVNASRIVGVIVLVLFFGLALGAGAVVSNQVTAPILTLMQATEQIDNGTFDPAMLEAMSQRSDEIGHLARSFVRMAHDLSEREAALMAEADEIRGKLAQV